MARVTFCRVQPWLVPALGVILFSGLPAETASGFAPPSPEVQAMVDKAVGYLETTKVTDDRFGAKSVVALALIKAGRPPDHPKVLEAVNEIRAKISSLDGGVEDSIVYGTGVSLIFLINLDPVKYRPEIDALLKYLLSIQKPHGGWGYPQKPAGDTSMTQYSVLGTWEACQSGISVPEDAIRRVTEWLVKTQDPNGGFGYQGTVSPTNAPVPQEDVRLSTAVAGLGSLYMCANLLELGHPNEKAEGLPPALELVEKRGPVRAQYAALSQAARDGQAAGNRWVQNNYRISVEHQPGTTTNWTYYYLYALERYWSLRESVEGESRGASRWYLDGARFLKSAQGADGSWNSNDVCGVLCDTSFGVLFLVRSMKKSIERIRDFGPGTLIGGRGLPKDTDAVVVRGGTVMSIPEVESVEAVLAAVGDSGDPEEYLKIQALASMASQDAVPLIDAHAEKLRQLVGGASPDARLAAVSALARRRNMDDVPVLIYALTDPDPRVVLEARDGLRRISRKFHGFGLPDDFNDAQRRTAVAQWKAWYRTVRPDAEFRD